jgi:hypothetical protein
LAPGWNRTKTIRPSGDCPSDAAGEADGARLAPCELETDGLGLAAAGDPSLGCGTRLEQAASRPAAATAANVRRDSQERPGREQRNLSVSGSVWASSGIEPAGAESSAD